MIGLTERLKSLGFVVDVPVTEKGEYHYFYHAYVKDLSSNTSLIIEGYRKKGIQRTVLHSIKQLTLEGVLK